MTKTKTILLHYPFKQMHGCIPLQEPYVIIWNHIFTSSIEHLSKTIYMLFLSYSSYIRIP